MSRPLLLDLFCCQGGAAMGYHRAGFDVVGVDMSPQPRYPFEFVQGDALEFLAREGRRFDAVHASPPCQDHSALSTRAGKHGTAELLPQTRAALLELGKPWVIENVEGALMAGALTLCGTEFGLSVVTRSGERRWLKRHRQFEASFALWGAGGCSCGARLGQIVGVYGTGGGGHMPNGAYKAYPEEAAAVMGVPWMDRYGQSQAIPPVYTEFIGEQLLAEVMAWA